MWYNRDQTGIGGMQDNCLNPVISLWTLMRFTTVVYSFYFYAFGFDFKEPPCNVFCYIFK